MALLLKKHEMPEQNPAIRAHNFKEVALGYEEETAIEEAKRCLNCKEPHCRKGCPVGVNIPSFIEQIKNRNYSEANRIIKEANYFPAICGRVCPQENQCEKNCILGIKGEAVAIGRLERFVADFSMENYDIENQLDITPIDQKIAIIGSGPAGLSAAGALVQKGYKVTIFEALHKAGGVLSYGIPEFRLPKENIVQKEIKKLELLGVKIELNSVIGQLYSVDELLNEEEFNAVFIATGAGVPYFLNIIGENLNGVYSANEFLTRVNLMQAYKFPEYMTPVHVGKRVAIIGGGNVAMDAARTALRLGGNEVFIVYRRGEEDLPARKEEIYHAKDEGIIFKLLVNPVKIKGDEKGNVTAITLERMEFVDTYVSEKKGVKSIPDSEFDLPVDTVIVAIGQGVNPIISQTTKDLVVDKYGHIIVDENCKTTKKGVFAGGDIVTGAATVIMAMEAGKNAANAIDKYLKELKE